MEQSTQHNKPCWIFVRKLVATAKGQESNPGPAGSALIAVMPTSGGDDPGLLIRSLLLAGEFFAELMQSCGSGLSGD